MKLFQMLFNFLSIKYILLNLIFRKKALILVILKKVINNSILLLKIPYFK